MPMILPPRYAYHCRGSRLRYRQKKDGRWRDTNRHERDAIKAMLAAHIAGDQESFAEALRKLQKASGEDNQCQR